MIANTTEPAIDQADVIVIGGGPAGATAATLVAQHGHRVLLFERDQFPRFHIGESLIPETYWVLERLGMLEKLRGSAYVRKHSVQFINAQGKVSAPFYFEDHKPHEASRTWQVSRDTFDQLMMTNAREQGVEVHEGARVLEVLFDGSQATGVRVRLADGNERHVMAKVVIDASGQSSMIMSRLGLRDWDPELKKAAIWTYWENAHRESGRDAGATLVMQCEDKKGWFWYIPLENNIVSVGVVSDYDVLFQNRQTKDHEAIYQEQMAHCPGLPPKLTEAKRVAPFRVAKEYSYRSRQAAGDGWVLVGDALGFLDPLYSSGVLLALKSGELAADAVADGLAKQDVSASQLNGWAEEYFKGMNRMRKLVCAYYSGISFGTFLRKYPQFRGLLTDLLIGDLFKDEFGELFTRLDEEMVQQQVMAAV